MLTLESSSLASNTTQYLSELSISFVAGVSLLDAEAHSKDQTDAAGVKNSDKIGADLSGAKHGCAQPSSVVSDAAGNFRGLSSLLVSNQIDLIGSWCRRAQLNNGSPLWLCKELAQRACSRFASLYLRYVDRTPQHLQNRGAGDSPPAP